MKKIIKHNSFDKWLRSLKNKVAVRNIAARIDRLAMGNAGDTKPVGEGVLEMRVHCGAGYRVYFIEQGETLIILLSGGDKSSQDRDIARSKQIAKEWRQNK